MSRLLGLLRHACTRTRTQTSSPLLQRPRHVCRQKRLRRAQSRRPREQELGDGVDPWRRIRRRNQGRRGGGAIALGVPVPVPTAAHAPHALVAPLLPLFSGPPAVKPTARRGAVAPRRPRGLNLPARSLMRPLGERTWGDLHFNGGGKRSGRPSASPCGESSITCHEYFQLHFCGSSLKQN